VDVVAVERRDEGLVQQADGLRGDAVGRVLGVVDEARVMLAILVVLHQELELLSGAHHLGGVGVEEVEETTFLGEQAAEHGGEFIAIMRAIRNLFFWIAPR
jgi:hypothetical protein